MLVVKLLSLGVLATIFFQDFRERAVYWVWFPALTSLLLFIRLYHTDSLDLWWQTTAFNVILMGIQLLLVTAYFSWRKRRLVNITNGLLGWGDLLFLLSITVYLSVANYMFFYTISLTVSLMVWVTIKAVAQKRTEKIPLAGLQAIVLLLFLAADWGPHWIKLNDDAWILNLIGK